MMIMMYSGIPPAVIMLHNNKFYLFILFYYYYYFIIYYFYYNFNEATHIGHLTARRGESSSTFAHYLTTSFYKFKESVLRI